jgi:hypothetical protein
MGTQRLEKGKRREREKIKKKEEKRKLRRRIDVQSGRLFILLIDRL